jgi:hypothetical protein
MDESHGVADVVGLAADGHAKLAIDELPQVLAEHGVVFDEEDLARAAAVMGVARVHVFFSWV